MRGLTGRIIQRFEDAGLKIVGIKMQQVDADLAARHYADLAERRGQAVFDAIVAFMQQGPVVAIALEGVDAVANVRKMVGATFPDQAPCGTIRGDFAHTSQAHTQAEGKVVANLVHASGNTDEAKYEVDLWFDDGELFDYKTVTEVFTF